MTHAHRIAIASGKGGVGKTWFAITLAHAMAEAGRRILLVDADLGLANIDVQLGLPPGPDLAAVLERGAPVAAAIRPHEAGFAVLAGSSGTGALAALPPAAIDQLLAALVPLPYDAILLDCGAGLEAGTRRLAAAATTLLVLATDEPTSLTDAYAVLKLHRQDGGTNARLVINQAADPAAGQRTYAALTKATAHFLRFTPPLAGIVRHDPRVADTIRHQAPLLTRHPNSQAADDVRGMARRFDLCPV